MARYDPRYLYGPGYAAGQGLIDFAQLLRQGTTDWQRQQTVDEESQRRDQDLMLRLQQFLAQSEDRDLDRQVKEGQLALNAAQVGDLRAKRVADAATAEAGRSGVAKLLGVNPMTADEAPASPEFAADPERLQPNILRALVPRKRTAQEAVAAAGMTPEQTGHKDVTDLLAKFYAAQEPKAPEPYNLPKGGKRFNAQNQLVAENPDEPKQTKPFYEGKSATELSIIVADPTSSPEDVSKAKAALRDISARETDKFAAQGRAQGEAMVSREGRKYDEVPLGDEAGRWIGSGGKPVSPGLSRKEAVSAGARPVGSVQEAQALRAAAGIARYLDQYMSVIPLYPDAGSSDAVNLLNAGVNGAKIYMARKSGGAATKIDALEGQVTRLIRAFGDTGNAAVQERAVTMQAVPGYMETKQSAADKLRTLVSQIIGTFEDFGVDPPPQYAAMLTRLDEMTSGSTGLDAKKARIRELEQKARQ